jgi:hypothetical protein
VKIASRPADKYLTSGEVTRSDQHCSLLFYGIDYGCKKIQHKHGFRVSLELPVLVEEEDKAPECHEDHSGELAHFKCPRNVWNVV